MQRLPAVGICTLDMEDSGEAHQQIENGRPSMKERKAVISGLARRMRDSDLLEILGYIGRVIALAAFIITAWQFTQQRRDSVKTRHYQAWQVIHAASGQQVSGARISALEDLVGDRVSLADINISQTRLRNIRLPNVDFSHANLFKADLCEATLSGANLFRANLAGANLSSANVSSAYLYWADLPLAFLGDTNLHGANLHDADLTGAILSKCDLSVADLTLADLSKAVFYYTNLRDANLAHANLKDIRDWNTACWEGANLYEVRDAPDDFLAFARTRGAHFTPTEEGMRLARSKEQQEQKRLLEQEVLNCLRDIEDMYKPEWGATKNVTVYSIIE